MKIIPLIILLALLVACAAPSTITFKNGKVESASNYTITQPGVVYNPYIPDNWFTSAMKQMLEGLAPYIGAFTQFFSGGKVVVPTVTPAPTPAPTPEPVVRPYP